MKRIFILLPISLCLVIILPGCNTFDTLLPATASATPASQSPRSPTTTEASSPTAEVATQTAEPIACPSLDAQVRAEMDLIEEQVVALRGLQPDARVERLLLTPSQLRQRVIDDFLADYSEEEAQDDARVLVLLGLLDPEFDLWNFYADLFSEQIAGFYDDTEEQMAIICGAGFKGPERITYSHEYTHALQDQIYDLEGGLGYNDELCDEDSERCAAIQALIEGDASLLEEQWLQIYATEEDFNELIEFMGELDTPVYDTAPRFIRQDFLFPYIAGRMFVEAMFRDGGWAAVDEAYRNPPQSTEQILHPERYPRDVPVRLVLPDLVSVLGDGWREIERNTLGEWYTQLVLNEFLPKADAVRASAGWGGDTYLALYNDAAEQGILILVTQWDRVTDVFEFADAFSDYGDTRFGGRQQATPYTSTWEGEGFFIYFDHISNQSVWILAPDAETAEALRQALTFPVQTE